MEIKTPTDPPKNPPNGRRFTFTNYTDYENSTQCYIFGESNI